MNPFPFPEISLLIWIGTTAAFLVFAVALANRFFAQRLSEQKPADWPGLVSILIPARNEEKNIASLLESIEAERECGRVDLEVLVLDDHSSDGTRDKIVSSPGYGFYVTLIEGSAVPAGWTGKNWACHQLATRARGNILLFVDADVSYSGEAVAKTLSLFQNRKISMVSVFPKQIAKTFFEKMAVPLIDFLLLSFLPLRFVTFFKSPALAAANGQWLAFRTESYRLIGGHASVKGEVLEDMKIARRAKSMGETMATLIGGETPVCRMYRGLGDLWPGLSKNTFDLLGGNTASFVGIFGILFFLDLLPWILLGTGQVWALPWIFLRYLTRACTGGLGGWPHLLLHPFSILFFLALALNSFRWHRQGKVFWKGREIAVGGPR